MVDDNKKLLLFHKQIFKCPGKKFTLHNTYFAEGIKYL